MRTGKRILSLLLLALLLAVLPAATHAAPPKGDTHVHNWSVTSSTAPTCTAAGSTTWTCSLCGQTYTEATPALGHSWDGGVTTAPTCTAAGSTTWTCTRCGQTRTESTPALGHSWSGTIAQPPTCMEEGVKSYYCTRCGLTAAEILPKIDHDPVDVPALAPTCTEEGHTEGQSCSMCGLVMSGQEPIPALGHSWSDWATLTEASCTEAGSEVRTCNVCGIEETRPVDVLGHLPEALPAQAPTCTEEGLTEGVVCARCQAVLQAQEPVPALGHDWDEGVVTTEPSGFTPGVRTFTCKHDPSHTRTEEIDPAPWLFATFTGSIPDFNTYETVTHDLKPLIIVADPVGGAITRDSGETVPLHVAASGGTGEYSYQWYCMNNYKGWKALWNWPSAVGDDSPDYAAGVGNKKYYCLVTDSAGETAASQYAEVIYKLSIADQPDNVNLQSSGNHTLTCEATDGSGDYLYTWRTPGDSIHDIGQTVPVSEPGEYFCRVMDNVTGDTVDSETCTVYSVEPFRLMRFTGDGEHFSDSSGILVAGFAGGVEPYEIWWDKDGEAIDSVDSEVDDYIGSLVYNATVGNYTVHAVDAMGEVVTATSHRIAPKLTIVQQPEDGVIIKGTHGQISVAVSDGDAPYTFTLFRNGKYLVQATENSKTSTFAVWYPGEYLFLISDAKGRSAKSDPAYFEDSVFRITSQTETSSITRLYGSANMSVTAEGGKEPYTYTWPYQNGGSWFKVGENADVISVYKPGVYSCTVKDSANQSIKSKQITVTYTGKVPMIVEQPTSRRELSKDVRWIDLKCKAISGTGDDSNLRYDWYTRKSGGGWTIYAADIQSYPGYFAGEYRCKVTDTATGGYTWSEVAVAYEELACTGVTQTQSWASEARFVVSVKGGLAPYTLNLYQKYPYWTDYGWRTKDAFFYSETYNSLEELNADKWDIPTVVDVLQGINENGELVLTTHRAVYYFVIIDATGNKYTSAEFSRE